MKKTILTALYLIPALALSADIHADYLEGEKSAELITPDISHAASQMLGEENAAKLIHAIRLQMTKYDLDMQSDAGRKKWHGKLVKEEIYTNEAVKVEVYSNSVDGTVWRYKIPFKAADIRKFVSSYNAKLPKPPMTNGIPVALARARMRRYEEKNTVSNVTVNVTVGGN